jgi:hypothetical protein
MTTSFNIVKSPPSYILSSTTVKMSMFRSKKLDLGHFVNIKVIRDHTKRKVFAEHEPERYAIDLEWKFRRLGEMGTE